MGQGIDAARDIAPEHAQAIDNMKDQLLIVLFKRLGGKVKLPIDEVDDTGGYMLLFSVDQKKRTLNFEVTKKC